MATRGEIMQNSHLNISSDMAREYFKESGLDYTDINLAHCRKLRWFINKICGKLCADESYSMVKDLEICYTIKNNSHGHFLFMNGSYFDKREGISFFKNKPEFPIGFCGWADGCNRTPVIQGFIQWCDWMKEKKKNGDAYTILEDEQNE